MPRTVCIISPNKDYYSETFIPAHIYQLPAVVRSLYGGFFPKYIDNGEKLLPDEKIYKTRIKNKIKKLFHLNPDFYKKNALSKFFVKNNIQVVLAEYGPTGVAVMDVCKRLRIPLIVHFHGFDAFRYDIVNNYKHFYLELFKIAAAIISVSYDMSDQLNRLGAPHGKVFYNPCGVDIDEFTKANPALNEPIFLFVGRFVDKKAPNLTLLAFQKTLQVYPDARLRMCGDGPLLDICKKMSIDLCISEEVEFLGSCSHSCIKTLIQEARAFVLHSIKPPSGDSEGTPVAILEACASGLPVISTKHAGIKDVIMENINGFLVDEGDIHMMSKYMIQIADSPELAKKMGCEGRRIIQERYSMELSINRLWQIIENSIFC